MWHPSIFQGAFTSLLESPHDDNDDKHNMKKTKPFGVDACPETMKFIRVSSYVLRS